ncbi:MAG: transposase, partial [Acidimicrobiales bacterium]
TGKNPTDRGKLGWKWSILTDHHGIPFGVAVDGANRNDSVLLAPTLDDANAKGLLQDVETLWLDRGYDSEATRERLKDRKITDAVIAKKRKRGTTGGVKHNQPMGLRWTVSRSLLKFSGGHSSFRLLPDRIRRLYQSTVGPRDGAR